MPAPPVVAPSPKFPLALATVKASYLDGLGSSSLVARISDHRLNKSPLRYPASLLITRLFPDLPCLLELHPNKEVALSDSHTRQTLTKDASS